MTQIIKDIVTWLKDWFYTEDEVDDIAEGLQNQINNKADSTTVSSLSTTVSGKANSVHTHGNIQNDGVLKVSGTAQASKSVCTDANGNITAEAKNNHTHNYIPNNADGSTTGNLTATTSGKGIITANSFKKNGGTTSQFLKANGDVDSNVYIHTAGTNLSKSNNTLNHATSGVGAKSSGLYKTTIDAQGHITAATAVAKADITGLGIPAQDTTYTASNAEAKVNNYKSNGIAGTSTEYSRADHQHTRLYSWCTGGVSTACYVNILEFSVNQSWNDRPITLMIQQRAKQTPSYLSIKLTNTNIDSANYSIDTFVVWGTNTTFYLRQVDTNKWNLMAYKAANDSFYVVDLFSGNGAVQFSSLNTSFGTTAPTNTTANPLKTSTYIAGATPFGTTANTVAQGNHTHSYLPLSGGTLTGNVVYPIESNSSSNTAAGNLVWGGTPTYDTDMWTTLKNKKSQLSTISVPNDKWYNVISVRHRNGSGDGSNYGMYIKTALQNDDGLIWAKQKGTSSYMAERTILDSSNYSTYANKTTIANNLTTSTAGSALDATQGKALQDNKLNKNADDTSTGYITAKGFKVSGKSNFLKADGTTADANNYSHPSTHAATMITDATKHDNIGSAANDTQATINTKIDTALAGKQASGSYATSSHNHSGTYVDGAGTKNSTNGSAIAEIKANTTVKGTIYHPKVNTNALTGVPTADTTIGSAGTFTVSQPSVNTDGHVTALTTRTYTLPTGSTSQKGILQIGTGSGNAAAGNHTHDYIATSPTTTTFTQVNQTKFNTSSCINFYKFGKLIVAYFRVLTDTNLTTSYDAFTETNYPIASGYRPVNDTISLNLCHYNTDTPSILTTRVHTDGTIDMRINTSTRAVNTYFTMTWVTN